MKHLHFFCDALIDPLNQGASGVSECEEMLAVTSFFNSLFRKVCCLVYLNLQLRVAGSLLFVFYVEKYGN